MLIKYSNYYTTPQIKNLINKRVLRRIFGPNRDEIICWKNLHIEEFHDLDSSPYN
jgi:hypothetical protein